MDNQQCDIGQDVKRLFEIKQQQRAAAKDYYQNFLYNPHRPINDGVPFDPALQRFSAMSAYHIDYFKPTPKIFGAFLLSLTPIALYSWYLYYSRGKLEEKLRGGEIAYHDRKYKLIF